MRILADVFLCEEEEAGRWRVRAALLTGGFEAGCEVTEAELEMEEEGLSEGRVLGIDEVELKV